MKFIPKVKTVSKTAEIGTAIIQNKVCAPGEFTPGKMPAGGFQSVWNFKIDEPNDYFTRKMSPTSGGGKKVY